MTDETTAPPIDTTSSPVYELPPPLTDAQRLEVFDQRFRQLCVDTGINAAAFFLDHSQPGTISAQARGHNETIQFIRNIVDKTAMAAHYRVEREDRKRAAYEKRNPRQATPPV